MRTLTGSITDLMGKSLWLGIVLVFSGVAQGAQTGKVGQEVLEAIEAEGEANVVVALAKTPSWIPPHILAQESGVPRDTPDLSRLRREMTSLRTQVLSELYSSEFRERHQYHFLPALAG